MFNVKIDMSDLIHKLDTLTGGSFVRDVAQAVADEAVVPELAKEPFRTTRKKMIFVSARQRAFVMAAIRRGDIQVPYVRTGKIGLSEKRQTTNGMDVTVPVAYSDYVRTKGKQARYHDPLWPTTDDIAREIEADEAELIGTAAVIKALNDAGLT